MAEVLAEAENASAETIVKVPRWGNSREFRGQPPEAAPAGSCLPGPGARAGAGRGGGS